MNEFLIKYDAARVQRYHNLPDYSGAPKQNLAEHQWGVAMLCWELSLRRGTAPSVSLLMAALTHDLSEAWLGDMPGNVKWEYPGLAREYAEAEAMVEEQIGTRISLSKYERTVLRWADGLELYIYSHRRGGAAYLACADKVSSNLCGAGPELAEGKALLFELILELEGTP